MAAASSSASLQAPVSLNDKAAAMGGSVDGDRAAGDCGLHWNYPAHLDQLAAPRRYDLVVATDVVYVQEPVPHLVTAMDALADAERSVVLLGYQIRSPEAHQAFWDAVPAAFPVIEKVPREHLDPEYAFEESLCSCSVGGRGSEIFALLHQAFT
ncbi:protein N-lysine methyltransferase METTL21A [Hordeum vulgare]|nr:protein N-lysine methyltransferase METTL21A [Hordeum vulgare]